MEVALQAPALGVAGLDDAHARGGELLAGVRVGDGLGREVGEVADAELGLRREGLGVAGDDHRAPQVAREDDRRADGRLDPGRAQRLGQRAGLAVEAVVARGAMGAPDRRGDGVAVEVERRADGDRPGALAPHPHDERGAVGVVAQDVADARVERAPDLLGDEAEEPLGLDLGGDRRGDPAQRGLLLGHPLQRAARPGGAR